MFNHQLSQAIEKELNSTINMFHHRISQERANESKQLNSSIETINSQLNQRYSILVNDTRQLVADLGRIGQYQSYTAASCSAVLLYNSSSPSGYYWVRSSSGSAVRVYCDMTSSCGGITGGWMRVTELDMTDSVPVVSDSTLIPIYVHVQGIQILEDVTLLTNNFEFLRVCGKIKAYQFGHPDAFRNDVSNINGNYVDGVSLTHGRPRQHIWTFAAARDESEIHPRSNCPCTNTCVGRRATPPPAFVGNDYFCDTGSSYDYANAIFYSGDPLWDGAGCGLNNACCFFNNPPWFYKQLPQPTTDDIEMRVCRNE